MNTWVSFALVPLVVTAEWVSLLQSPGPSQPELYISPVVYNHTLIGPESTNGAPTALWFTAQWNNPAPVTASTPIIRGPGVCTQTHDTTTVWHVDTHAYRVCESANQSHIVVEITQDGSGKGGAPELPCGAEFDGFLSPTSPGYDGGIPSNIPPVWNASNLPLSDLSALVVGFTIQLDELRVVSPRCGPLGGYYYIVLALPILTGLRHLFQAHAGPLAIWITATLHLA